MASTKLLNRILRHAYRKERPDTRDPVVEPDPRANPGGLEPPSETDDAALGNDEVPVIHETLGLRPEDKGSLRDRLRRSK